MNQQNAPVTRLNSKALAALPDSVAVPGYDRSRLTVGIVHVGVGGFHRSHQAMYIDRLMTAGTSYDWGICGVGLLPGNRAMQL
jgi:mannitol 2-dehydrogenase